MAPGRNPLSTSGSCFGRLRCGQEEWGERTALWFSDGSVEAFGVAGAAPAVLD